MIKQFLTDVVWGDIDYLVIDTPPGTSDEHITVVEQLKKIKPDGAVMVTTPQVKFKHTHVQRLVFSSLHMYITSCRV